MTRARFFFPLFNTFIGAILGALVGYYVSRLAESILLGALAGFSFALLLEILLGAFGQTHWLYKRRALGAILVEIPFVILVVGPFAYVLNYLAPDPHPICCVTPRDFGAAQYETVRIETRDGAILAGWYVPPRVQPGAVVILLHGARGDRTGTVWHARRLSDAGYGVLLYDQRALGESRGAMNSFAWLDGTDLLAVVDWLTQRPEVDARKIGAVGISLGGHVALNAVTRAPAAFAAVWADGVQAQRIEDFPVAQNFGESFTTFLNARILAMMEWYVGAPTPPSFTALFTNMRRPNILLIVGALDDFENRAHRQYARILPPNTRQWFIANAEHVGGPVVVPDEYTQRMLEFFHTNLMQAKQNESD